MDKGKKKKKAGIKCLKCKSVIFSRHRHHFVYCDCKDCFVEGGDDYLRIGGNSGDYEIVYEGDAK